MRRPSTLVSLATALLVCAFFLCFAASGLRSYFTADDMMNLYTWWSEPAGKLVKANLLFFSNAYRPMGGVFYTSLFALFGFQPLPFRVACLLLLLANLWLLRPL